MLEVLTGETAQPIDQHSLKRFAGAEGGLENDDTIGLKWLGLCTACLKFHKFQHVSDQCRHDKG